MSKQAIKTIEDRTYVINTFKGRKGWSFLPRITKYVFPFVEFMVNEKTETQVVVEQLTQLLSGENAKEVEQLFIDLVQDIQVDGSTIDFDKEFEQNYGTLLLLVVEVLKLNYLESFQKLVTNLPK